MSNDYFFRLLLPPGPTSESFGHTADQILDEAGVPHEIKRKDWGTFVAYRVLVPKVLERKAAYRLDSFAEFLRSQGPVSTRHVIVTNAHWVQQGRPPARPVTGR